VRLEKLFAEPSVLNYIRTTFDISNVIIVSPDAGGAKRYKFVVYVENSGLMLTCVSELLQWPID
jgi:phosphoribosylpyrophosphate synthetase